MSITLDPMLITLAETSTPKILIWVTAMIVLVIGGGIATAMLRRRYHDDGGAGLPLESLSLHTLREMHAQGGLSDEEFEILKEAAVRSHTETGSIKPMQISAGSGVMANPGFDLAGDPLPSPPQSDETIQGENESGPETEPRPDA